MPSPIQAAGAVANPSHFGALGMGARQFTGIWTQRSPYRDAAVEYLVSKFYGGSRFDSILDGINREITQRMTDQRAPGSIVFNTNTFPAINSYAAWKFIQNQVEQFRTLADGSDGNVYDATPGQKTTLYAKNAGAGRTRFLGVNTTMFTGDGNKARKILQTAKTWQATTTYNVGDLIIDTNGNIQKAYSVPLVCAVTSVEQFADGGVEYVRITLNQNAGSGTQPAGLFVLDPAQTVALAGLTNATWLNGTTLTKVYPFGPYGNQFQGVTGVSHADYPDTADTGTATGRTQTGSGQSGGVAPTWQTGLRHFTTDGQLIWQCYTGGTVSDWGLNTPPTAPLTAPTFTTERYWLPGQIFTGATSPLFVYSLLDPNNNVQVLILDAGEFYQNGASPPNWNANVGGLTAGAYMNFGQPTSWFAATDYGGTSAGVLNPCVILDSNGNLQGMTNGTIVTSPPQFPAQNALTSGATQPSWLTAPGDLTVDGPITWICLGPGAILTSAALQWAWSTHSIDGSVSTASPINSAIAEGIMGPNGLFGINLSGGFRALNGPAVNADNGAVDEVWLWRTAQGQATLIRVARIPLPALNPANETWSYVDMLPDTALNAQVPAPVADAGDPPPANITAPAFHLKRVWGIVDNAVVWSGGPDTVTGNGNTAFPPLNNIPYVAQPIKLIPVTVQDGGILVLTTDGIFIILGSGQSGDPFYSTSYFDKVDVQSYDAIDTYGNALYLMESNSKVSSVAVQYPFNPQSGYTEIGFPIGDQFMKVTTGGISAALYDPGTAYLSWNVQNTFETGMYVADGAVGWFRMSMVSPPESGLLWSPRRAILGGTSAVQSVQTGPKTRQLLIGPPAGTPGPILCRDATQTVWTDLLAGVATGYPAWDAKGVNVLCSTGQVSEVAHIATKSAAVGARPAISVLLGEIAPSTARPWDLLKLDFKSNDPPKVLASVSAYSDRYVLRQNGEQNLGDCILTKFDYGTQAAGDELLSWETLAAIHEEREAEAEKVK